MALKVCVLTSAHPPFDVRIFHKECKSLVRAGYDVTLIAAGAEDVIVDGVHIKPIPKPKDRFDRMYRGALEVYRRANEENADVYHFHDPELIPIALLLRLSGKKVIYDAHEDLPHTFSYKSYIPWFLRPLAAGTVGLIERAACRAFSALVVANPTTADRLRHVNGPAVVVHNYPKLEEFQTGDGEEAERPVRDGSFLYVGMRITRARGAEEMVQAIGLLPESVQARLKLVGAWDPPTLPQELCRLNGWQKTDHLGLLGRAGVAQALRRARAGLVVLHPEPNYLTAEPVKLFEYMCAGIPVIAGDFPSCRQIIERVGCGLLVDPLDPEQIAAAMLYLYNNEAEAEAMGKRGLQAALSDYNWSHEEKVLCQLYRSLWKPPFESLNQPATAR